MLVVFRLLFLLGFWSYHGAPYCGCVLVCSAHPSEVQGFELGDLGEDVLVVALGSLQWVAVERERDEFGESGQLVHLLQVHDVVAMEIKHGEVWQLQDGLGRMMEV